MSPRVIAILLIALAVASRSAAAVEIEWVDVGSPGNADDPAYGVTGSVPYSYRIARYETTNAQWVEFLNAVATDTSGFLWNPLMVLITRSGTAGSYSYSTTAPDVPVQYVTWWSALRFANWIHNGQPTGAAGIGTTDTGAYDIAGFAGGPWIAREPGAEVFLPTYAEWYKAAYYDPTTDSYWRQATGPSLDPVCDGPVEATNRARCSVSIFPGNSSPTSVGTYLNATSPWGTFNQAGNVSEWCEDESFFPGNARRSSGHYSSGLLDNVRSNIGTDGPVSLAQAVIGFRLAAPAAAQPVPTVRPGALAVLFALSVALVSAIGLRRSEARRGTA